MESTWNIWTNSGITSRWRDADSYGTDGNSYSTSARRACTWNSSSQQQRRRRCGGQDGDGDLRPLLHEFCENESDWHSRPFFKHSQSAYSKAAERGRQIDRYWPDHHYTEVTGTQERHQRDDGIVEKTCHFRGHVHHYCEHRPGDSRNLPGIRAPKCTRWVKPTAKYVDECLDIVQRQYAMQWWHLWRNRRVWICTMRRQRVIKFNTHCSSTSPEWDQIWCSRHNACHANLRRQHLRIWHVPRKCWDIWKEHAYGSRFPVFSRLPSPVTAAFIAESLFDHTVFSSIMFLYAKMFSAYIHD